MQPDGTDFVLDEIQPLWHLHDEFTVEQAAALIAGYDPGQIIRCEDDSYFEDEFPGLHPARTALVNAITGGRLEATTRNRAPTESEDERRFDVEPDWSLTTVSLESVRNWLTTRGINSGFFFPTPNSAPDYLDPGNPRYAPKLAAAVRAWQAVTDPKGTSPKQALLKWLREHAANFKLTDEEGKPNEFGIEEVAKVANWQLGGGAPKTPGA